MAWSGCLDWQWQSTGACDVIRDHVQAVQFEGESVGLSSNLTALPTNHTTTTLLVTSRRCSQCFMAENKQTF